VLSVPVNVATLDMVAESLLEKAKSSQPSYVCVANVHMLVTAKKTADLLSVMNEAALVCSDGMPLVWELRRQGYPQAERVSGPDLVLRVCELAEQDGVPVYFFGGSDRVAGLLEQRLHAAYPRLNVVGLEAPPILPERMQMDSDLVRKIKASGAKIVFVGLGCPKQEYWMHTYVNQLDAVLVGVGAAFDFIAGSKRRAPAWMQSYGLEWFFRLCSEPRRLWKRYLYTNMTYLYLLSKSWFVSSRAVKTRGE